MSRFRQMMMAAAVIVAGAAATPALARDAVSLSINVGPPPPRVEYVPTPPPSGYYVWAPGYWNWNGHRHVWVNGRYMQGRHNQAWVPDRWAHRGDGWYHERGHWRG
jgi:hypothetical protein